MDTLTHVRVYRNLRKKCYSVQVKLDGVWKVCNWQEQVILSNARFIVSEAGRQRVLREKRKNVHAYVEGDVLGVADYGGLHNMVVGKITYNPYKDAFFRDEESNKKIESASVVVLSGDGVFYSETKVP